MDTEQLELLLLQVTVLEYMCYKFTLHLQISYLVLMKRD